MSLRRSDPANFDGPGGQEHDPELLSSATLRSDLVKLAGGCCLEHAAKIVDKILDEYKVTPKKKRKYP